MCIVHLQSLVINTSIKITILLCVYKIQTNHYILLLLL